MLVDSSVMSSFCIWFKHWLIAMSSVFGSDFRKFKQVNARDNYMQVYNNQYINNCI